MSMKLHDIVELRESLKDVYATERIHSELDLIAENINIIRERANEDYSYRLGEMLKTIESFKESLKGPIAQLNDVNEIIKKDLADATEKFSAPDYQDQLRYANPDRIREIRKMYIPSGVDEIVYRAIDLYVDWRYPALEIGCRDGEYTSNLVSCDPLYITDVHQEFLDSTLSKYPPEYQRRLRPYLIGADMSLSQLPADQFGFVFSWNFFNYLSLENIHRYLTQIFDLLRPGGTFMFSYNNADMPAAASYADSYFMSYAPKSLLIPLCEQCGFIVASSTDLEPAISWVELRKPGELKMIKAHQVLGEIKYVNP
jgi:SAM-dependent methyltransferase